MFRLFAQKNVTMAATAVSTVVLAVTLDDKTKKLRKEKEVVSNAQPTESPGPGK